MGGVFTVVPVRVQHYDVLDGFLVSFYFKLACESLPFSSVFRYARDFNDCLDAQRLNLGMLLHGHNSYMADNGIVRLTALGEWARRWLY